MIWMILAAFSLLMPFVAAPTPAAAGGPPTPTVGSGMPCYSYRLSQIRSQTWASYSCIDTSGYVVGVRVKDYDGHEQVHLRLRDGEHEYQAFWPAEQGTLAEGQRVRVRAVLVPLVRGETVIGWGLLIVHWEPTRPQLPNALEG